MNFQSNLRLVLKLGLDTINIHSECRIRTFFIMTGFGEMSVTSQLKVIKFHVQVDVEQSTE